MALLYIDTKDGEATLELHAHNLDRKLVQFRQHLARRLAADLRLEVPGHAMREHTFGRVTGATIRVGVFGLPFARALDRGAFIVAKGADRRHPGAEGPRALHFKGATGDVFVRYVVIKGTHYFEHALARSPFVIATTYRREFGNLDRA